MLHPREIDRPARRPAFVGLQTAAQVNDLLGISPANLWLFNEQGGPGTGTLTVSGAISNNETVTIDAVVYRWRTATLAQANDVLAGASVAIGLVNLVNAINGSDGSGSVYHTDTTPHTTVIATAYTATTAVVTARTYGTAGNSLATTETMANGAWGGATLAGGTGPGTCTDVVGGVVLTPTNSPTQAAGTRWPKLCVGFTDGGTQYMLASAAAELYHALDSFAFLTVWRTPVANPSVVRMLLAKEASISAAGYRLRVNAVGTLRWQVLDGVDESTSVAGSVGVGTVPIWCGLDRTAAKTYLATPQGSANVTAVAVDTVTSEAVFRFGWSLGIGSAADAELLWAAHFTGAAGEGDGIEHVRRMYRGMP